MFKTVFEESYNVWDSVWHIRKDCLMWQIQSIQKRNSVKCWDGETSTDNKAAVNGTIVKFRLPEIRLNLYVPHTREHFQTLDSPESCLMNKWTNRLECDPELCDDVT